MYTLLGVRFTIKEQDFLQRFHAQNGIRTCSDLQQYPILCEKFRYLKQDVYKRVNMNELVDVIVNENPLMCRCGKEVIVDYGNGGKKCNHGFACKHFHKSVVTKRIKTSLDRYGVKCATHSKIAKAKRRKTCLKKYGVDNAAKSDAIVQKTKRTNLMRYGVDNPAKSDVVKQRIRNSNTTRFGCWSSQHPLVKQRAVKTNVEKYNGIAPACDVRVVEKARRTSRKRYGHNSWSESPEGRDYHKDVARRLYKPGSSSRDDILSRIKKTNIARYGVDNPWKSPTIIKRIRRTLRRRYGVEHALQDREFHDKQQRSMFRYKPFYVDGRFVEMQGFEHLATVYMLRRGMSPQNIKFGASDNVPSVDYQWNGSRRIYHPDMLVGNTIVEVKSEWTMFSTTTALKILKAKERGCIDAGYNFRLIVCGRDCAWIAPKLWSEWDYSHARRYVIKALAEAPRLFFPRRTSVVDLLLEARRVA